MKIQAKIFKNQSFKVNVVINSMVSS